jgi:hypothetical protein
MHIVRLRALGLGFDSEFEQKQLGMLRHLCNTSTIKCPIQKRLKLKSSTNWFAECANISHSIISDGLLYSYGHVPHAHERESVFEVVVSISPPHNSFMR